MIFEKLCNGRLFVCCTIASKSDLMPNWAFVRYPRGSFWGSVLGFGLVDIEGVVVVVSLLIVELEEYVFLADSSGRWQRLRCSGMRFERVGGCCSRQRKGLYVEL